MFSKQEAINQMNNWGRQRIPFLFILDFEGENNILHTLDNVPDTIQYSIGEDNIVKEKITNNFRFDANPIDIEQYSASFAQVLNELNYGNSYLINLTFPTKLKTDLGLKTIYDRSKARYKLLVEDDFVVFSPECFLRIQDDKIHSYPMKGTIDATIADAENKILSNEKEMAEHSTIVDLIRNDLNRVAENIRVEKFRYVERIETMKKPLLQVSSEVVGDLNRDYQNQLGSILFSMLPAGSISGAPKIKTIEIIKAAEMDNRGFFTGVFGVFDGEGLDCGVMIRFIERQGSQLVFRSGGGITAQSNLADEYNEMIQKVYVPFF